MREIKSNESANAVKVKYGYGDDRKFNMHGQDGAYLDPAINRSEFEIDNSNFMERQAKARGIL